MLAGCAIVGRLVNPFTIPSLTEALLERESTFVPDDSEREFDDLPFVANGVFEVTFNNTPIQEAVIQVNRFDPSVVVLWIDSTSVSNETSPSSVTDDNGREILDENPKSVEPILITGFFRGNIAEVLSDIAFACDINLERVGNKFYLTRFKADMAKVITHCSLETSLDEPTLEKLRAPFGDDVLFVLVGSKLQVSGRVYAVKSFVSLVEGLNETPRSYVATIVFVRLQQNQISKLEATLSAPKLDLISAGYSVYDMFDAQLDLKMDAGRIYNYTEQILYCTDNVKSSLDIGSERTRESRAVSDMGTSTVSGYTSFKDGISLTLQPFRKIGDTVDIQIEFENSKFDNDESLTKQQVNLQYDKISIQENRVYFIASFNEIKRTASSKFFGYNRDSDERVLTCWLVLSPVVSNRSSLCATKD